eukprot:7311047-Prymnesium_polylepis.2
MEKKSRSNSPYTSCMRAAEPQLSFGCEKDAAVASLCCRRASTPSSVYNWSRTSSTDERPYEARRRELIICVVRGRVPRPGLLSALSAQARLHHRWAATRWLRTSSF